MKKTLRTFGYFIQQYPTRSAFVVFLLVFAGLAEAFGIIWFLPFLQIVLDDQSPQNGMMGFAFEFLNSFGLSADFKTFSLLIISAMATKAIVLWLSMRFVADSVARIASDLRVRLLTALLKANWGYFTTYKLGSGLNAMASETARSSVAFIAGAKMLSSIVQFIVYSLSAAIVSLAVLSGGVLVAAILAALLWRLIGLSRSAGEKQTKTEKSILGHMADTLQGIKPLRAMALEKSFEHEIKNDSDSLQQAQYSQIIANQSMSIFHEPLVVISAIIGLYLIVTFTALPTSEIALMGILFMRMLTAVNGIQGQYQRLVVQESALWSLLDNIKLTEDQAESKQHAVDHQVDALDSIHSLEFKNVSFSHKDKLVLNHFDMTLKVNSMTALIGPSGSGKTTAMDLLCGFYKPETGEVILNETSLSKIDLGSWRSQIGFVPQEVFLFNASIRENICVGREDITDEQVWDALEASGAADFVSKMDDDLDSSAGEQGRKLSGGQRQRIAIARAIVHKPSVLLLDEPTSALDSATEKQIFETLRSLSKSMIILCISHNISVQSYADQVIEIEDGTVLNRKAA